MRVLLDECVPQQVRQALPDHDVMTTQRMGWSGMSNGDLINAAERAGFEVFIVADKNLRYQQNLTGRQIAILELWTNHRPTLENHLADVRAAVERIHTGEYLMLEKP